MPTQKRRDVAYGKGLLPSPSAGDGSATIRLLLEIARRQRLDEADRARQLAGGERVAGDLVGDGVGAQRLAGHALPLEQERGVALDDLLELGRHDEVEGETLGIAADVLRIIAVERGPHHLLAVAGP